jgi:hypothetical protein
LLHPGVPVQVWTSEGVTDGGYADIFVPLTFKGCDARETGSVLPGAN